MFISVVYVLILEGYEISMVLFKVELVYMVIGVFMGGSLFCDFSLWKVEVEELL